MSRWRKFVGLAFPRQRLLLEACFFVLIARAAIAMIPFSKLMGSLRWRSRTAIGDAQENARQVRWAVEAASRNLVVPLTCLPQALAAAWMLQIRGHTPGLLYGVSADGSGRFVSHSWVELDGIPVVGHRAASGFTLLARFPGLEAYD